jgi:uncharacterized membrane protein YgcG
MAEEIIFSDYQAEVFNEAENLLRTQGYLGEQLFEDTYVLQKRLADWVIDAVPVNGSTSSLMSEATNAYNGVLGIATDEAPAPVIVAAQSEPIITKPPVSIRETPQLAMPLPSFGVTGGIRPIRPVKPAIATPVAQPAPPRPIRTNVPTSIVRGNSGGGRGFTGIFANGFGTGGRNVGGGRGTGNGGSGIFGNGFGGFGNFNPFDR